MESLFVTLNNQKIELNIEEIFDTKKFNTIKAVTFSADKTFINKYFSDFENVELIIGIPDLEVQRRGAEAIQNLLSVTKKSAKKEQIELFENLSNKNQNNVIERKWKFRVPLKSTIHSKFYLLEGNGCNRLILGSANLSNQAFSDKSKQFENISIFDNSELYDLYKENFEILDSQCIDFITSAIIKKGKKIISKKKENEKAIPIVFSFNEHEGLQTEITKDYFENFKECFNEIANEEIEKEGGIGDQLKSVKSNYEQIEKENKEEEIFEKYAYEVVGEMVKKRAKTKKALLIEAKDLGDKVKKVLKIQIAPKIKEEVAERERLILKGNDMNEEHSGLYIVESKKENEELIYSTREFGKKATNEEIKESIKTICHLIENYKNFVKQYDDEYGSRVIETIFYAFTSPFFQEMRKILAKNNDSTVNLNFPMFMFLGGSSHSGKTSLLKLIIKMLGLSKKNEPNYYSKIVPEGKQWRADTIKQIDYWLREENVNPIFIDELDADFFKTRAENLIKNLSNETAESQKNTSVLIGSTNSNIFQLPDAAERRSYYITNDKEFDKSSIAERAYNEVSKKINSVLFNDFVIRMADKLSEDNVNLLNYSVCAEGEKVDFLYLTRQIFKEYFAIANISLPQWFPNGRYDDIVKRNMEKWKLRFQMNSEMFQLKFDKQPIYIFDLLMMSKIGEASGNKNVGNEYLNSILPNVKINNSNEAIVIDVFKFHNWIGLPIPEKFCLEIWKQYYLKNSNNFNFFLKDKCYHLDLEKIENIEDKENFIEMLNENCILDLEENIIKIKVFEFHNWINLPIPENINKQLEKKKSFFEKIFNKIY